MPLRRSRGYAPEPITLADARVNVPIAGRRRATEGDVRPGTRSPCVRQPSSGRSRSFRAPIRRSSSDIALYEKLFDIQPRLLVHDLHPDYASTRYARTALKQMAFQLLAVQHHHAHMASCMAEHGLTEPVIGVSFDGTGYGTDGAIWGGEFLVGDYRQFRRAAHLRYVGMPGGDQADSRAVANGAGPSARCRRERRNPDESRVDAAALRTIRQMMERTLQHAADLQRRPIVRCGGRPRRRSADPGQLRGASRDGAGMAGQRSRRATDPIPWEIELAIDGSPSSLTPVR